MRKESPKKMIDNFEKYCGTNPKKCTQPFAKEMFKLVKAFGAVHTIHIGVEQDPLYVLDSEYRLYVEVAAQSHCSPVLNKVHYIEFAKVSVERNFEGDEYRISLAKVDWNRLKTCNKVTFKTFSIKDMCAIIKRLNYYY